MLEVELKFPLADPAGFRRRLGEIGAVERLAVAQSDAYYNHPSRDFAQTDEALRVRTVSGDSVVTYKGPKLGGQAKTRFELELPLADATADGWGELLGRLGFRHVAIVKKQRTPFQLKDDGAGRGRAFEIVVDEVEGLGVFAEVETMADEADREAAEQAVANLAGGLGLLEAEPRSYLEMLLTG